MHTNIGRLAVEKQWLSPEQLQQSVALLDKSEGQETIEKVLYAQGLLSKEQIVS